MTSLSLIWGLLQVSSSTHILHPPPTAMLSTFKVHNEVMILADSRPMTNREHCDASIMACLVKLSLPIRAHLDRKQPFVNCVWCIILEHLNFAVYHAHMPLVETHMTGLVLH